MKRYKLKRDIPAFKAGTECYIEEAGHMVPCRGISYTIVHKDQLEKDPNILTDWFEEIKEPLVKDEKVRKAIMSWYEALPLDDLCDKRILFSNGGFCVGIYRIDCGNYVALKGIKERFYTIKELCEEDEE